MSMQSWLKRVKCLALVAIFISFGNCITTWKAGAIVTPLEAIPGVLLNIINLMKKWKGICSQVPFIVLKYRQGCI